MDLFSFQLKRQKSLIDFGCGPGLYTNQLAVSGAAVTGIDFSARSLSYAKQQAQEQGVKADYIQANYLDCEISEQYDLACMIMCDFCALSPTQRSSILKKFRTLLKPGAAVLLDVHSLVRFKQIREFATYELNQLNGFWSSSDYYGFVNTFTYDEEHLVLDKYTIIEADRIRYVYNWLQHFDPDSLKQELINAGFSHLEFYKNVAGDKYDDQHSEFAIVAS